jgi:hypothetical protein
MATLASEKAGEVRAGIRRGNVDPVSSDEPIRSFESHCVSPFLPVLGDIESPRETATSHSLIPGMVARRRIERRAEFGTLPWRGASEA